MPPRFPYLWQQYLRDARARALYNTSLRHSVRHASSWPAGLLVTLTRRFYDDWLGRVNIARPLKLAIKTHYMRGRNSRSGGRASGRGSYQVGSYFDFPEEQRNNWFAARDRHEYLASEARINQRVNAGGDAVLNGLMKMRDLYQGGAGMN